MIKKFLQVVIIGSSLLLYGEENKERKFNVAISLGEVCQPAGNLHANQMRFQAFPFDWAITPFESIYKFIAGEGKGFLDKETLLFNVAVPVFNVTGVLDLRYGVYSVHDFEYSVNDNTNTPKYFHEVTVKNYDAAKAKLERRIKRLFDALHSNKRVLLVRLGITYSEAIRLDALLHTQYPQLDYVIVAIDNSEEAKYDWGLKRVKNFYLERKTKFESRLEDWTKILTQFPFEYDGVKIENEET